MDLRYPRDPLGREGAPGNPFGTSGLFQFPVADRLPGLPPLLH